MSEFILEDSFTEGQPYTTTLAFKSEEGGLKMLMGETAGATLGVDVTREKALALGRWLIAEFSEPLRVESVTLPDSFTIKGGSGGLPK